MNKPALLVSLVAALAAAAGAFGQDAPGTDALGASGPDADVFDAAGFDQSVQQSKEQEKTSRLEILFGGDFLYDTAAYTTADFAGYALAGSFSGKSFVKASVPGYGVLYLAYNLSHNLYQGASGTVPGGSSSFLALPAGDLFAASFTLSELSLSFDIARAVFVKVGNQLLAWGPSFIWTPVDFFNLQRQNPLSALDLRVGKPALRISVPMGISNIFLVADLSGTVGSTPPLVKDPLEAANLGARVDLTVMGFELALTGYFGKSIQNWYGFDFSGSLLGFDVYGELAVAFPYDGYDFSYAYSVGLQRTFGELKYWSVQGELFSNSLGTSDTAGYAQRIIEKTFTPFYLGAYYAYAGITRSHLFVDGLAVSLAAFANLSDVSYLGRLSASVDVPGVVPFTFSLSYAGGGAGKEFTWFVGDNSLSADLQVRFSF